MRVYRICVNRPAMEGVDSWDTRRTAVAVTDSLDQAMQKAIDYYNDMEDVTDYYMTDISIEASTEAGEGAILLV